MRAVLVHGHALLACALLALAGCAGRDARQPAADAAAQRPPAPTADADAQPAAAAADPDVPAVAVPPTAAGAASTDAANAGEPDREAPAHAPAPTSATTDASGPLLDGTAVFRALRAQLATRECPGDDRVVARWLATYGRSPQRLAANLQRVLPLLAHVLQQVRDAGLPGEFALLPIVESWYRPDARHAGTAGLWQFSAGTARAYGLRVDATADQRLAPAPATAAALAHLADLLERFEDWRLAAMAYNAGAHRLSRAYDADPSIPSPAGHRPAGLSMVTYEHLAKLQALACLVLEPQRAGLELPTAPFEPHTPRTLLALGSDAAARAAQAAGVHEVRPGDSLWAIARRHGVAVADLLRWNALDAEAVLRPGQQIRLSP